MVQEGGTCGGSGNESASIRRELAGSTTEGNAEPRRLELSPASLFLERRPSFAGTLLTDQAVSFG
jgi:hypothetical protein